MKLRSKFLSNRAFFVAAEFLIHLKFSICLYRGKQELVVVLELCLGVLDIRRLEDVTETVDVDHCVVTVRHYFAVSVEEHLLDHVGTFENVRAWTINGRLALLEPEFGLHEAVMRDEAVGCLAGRLERRNVAGRGD